MFQPPSPPGIARTPSHLPPLPVSRPSSLKEAVRALGAPGAEAYAGGTDFFARLREGARPGALVWLRDVAEMRGIGRADAWLRIGALTTHHQAVADPALDAVPGLAAAWAKIATVRIRRQATLGGNLMARRCRYEMSILLSALGAEAEMAGPDGTVRLPIEDLWQADPGDKAVLVAIHIPLSGAPRLDYERSMRPTFTQAACLRGGALRLVIGTEWLRPCLLDGPPENAEDLLNSLPEDFHDPAVSRAHLQRVGRVFARRQLQRLEAMQ